MTTEPDELTEEVLRQAAQIIAKRLEDEADRRSESEWLGKGHKSGAWKHAANWIRVTFS